VGGPAKGTKKECEESALKKGEGASFTTNVVEKAATDPSPPAGKKERITLKGEWVL